ncbi:MAG: chitobiase/beta-hexosaminidase C-terminal domain-containing protein [Chthoniobacter sp.]
MRFEGPAGSRGDLAELEFDAGARKLTGVAFGPAGGHWKAVFDNKLESVYSVDNADPHYAGLDLGEQASTARPSITGITQSNQPVTVTMRCPMPGATVRYTRDGTTPDAHSGELYTAPFTVDKSSTLVAWPSMTAWPRARPRVASSPSARPRIRR